MSEFLHYLGEGDTDFLAIDAKAKLHAVYDRTTQDREGARYEVNYVRLHGSAHLLEIPAVQRMLPEILAITREAFPGIDATNIHTKFAGANGIGIIRTQSGEPAGYHVDKLRTLPGNPSVKVMYIAFAAVLSAYNGKRLTELSLISAIDIEDPDIIAGSTSVPAMIISNERIAQERGFTLYPKNPNPPAEVVALARIVYGITQNAPDPQREHPITSRLTRVRDTIVRQSGENRMPFLDDIMKLTEYEQIFYLLLKNDFQRRMLPGIGV